MTYQEHPRTPSLERLHVAKWASVMELSVSASLVEHQDKHLEASRQPLKSDISRMPVRAIFQHSVWHGRGYYIHVTTAIGAPGRKKAAPKLPQPRSKNANDLRFTKICSSPAWFSAYVVPFLSFSGIPGFMASRDAWEECSPNSHSTRESSANSVDTC